MQLDLIDAIKSYPRSAGYREHTTSRDAADAIEASGIAQRLRDACLSALEEMPSTAKELAEYLRVDKCSIRPRISELKARGLIEESGLRRDRQHVWRLR